MLQETLEAALEWALAELAGIFGGDVARSNEEVLGEVRGSCLDAQAQAGYVGVLHLNLGVMGKSGTDKYCNASPLLAGGGTWHVEDSVGGEVLLQGVGGDSTSLCDGDNVILMQPMPGIMLYQFVTGDHPRIPAEQA